MSKRGLLFRLDEVEIDGDRARVRLGPGTKGAVEFFAGTLHKELDGTGQIVRGYRVRCKPVLKKVRAVKVRLRLLDR